MGFVGFHGMFTTFLTVGKVMNLGMPHVLVSVSAPHCGMAETMIKPFIISGCNTFVINLWGKDSDSILQVLHLLGMLGCALSFQVSKPFLADRVFSANMENATNTGREEFAPFIILNTTFKKGNFETDIYNVYFIFGSCCMVGMIMQIACWLCSGCKVSHSLPFIEGQMKTPSLPNPQLQQSCNLVSLGSYVLLSFFAFLGFAVGSTFGGFGMTFTVNYFSWTTDVIWSPCM